MPPLTYLTAVLVQQRAGRVRIRLAVVVGVCRRDFGHRHVELPGREVLAQQLAVALRLQVHVGPAPRGRAARLALVDVRVLGALLDAAPEVLVRYAVHAELHERGVLLDDADHAALVGRDAVGPARTVTGHVVLRDGRVVAGLRGGVVLVEVLHDPHRGQTRAGRLADGDQVAVVGERRLLVEQHLVVAHALAPVVPVAPAHVVDRLADGVGDRGELLGDRRIRVHVGLHGAAGHREVVEVQAVVAGLRRADEERDGRDLVDGERVAGAPVGPVRAPGGAGRVERHVVGVPRLVDRQRLVVQGAVQHREGDGHGLGATGVGPVPLHRQRELVLAGQVEGHALVDLDHDVLPEAAAHEEVDAHAVAELAGDEAHPLRGDVGLAADEAVVVVGHAEIRVRRREALNERRRRVWRRRGGGRRSGQGLGRTERVRAPRGADDADDAGAGQRGRTGDKSDDEMTTMAHGIPLDRLRRRRAPRSVQQRGVLTFVDTRPISITKQQHS